MFDRLLEAADKRALLHWQQRVIEELPDELEVHINSPFLSVTDKSREIAKFSVPTVDVAWDGLKIWSDALHWYAKVAAILPTTRYTASVVSGSIGNDEKLNLRVYQNENPLFDLSTPSSRNNPMLQHFWVTGEAVESSVILEGGDKLKGELLNVLRAFELRRKLKNLLKLPINISKEKFTLSVRIYANSSILGSDTIIVKLRTEPSASYEVNLKRYMGGLQRIGSSADESKAIDLIQKGVADSQRREE